MSSKLVAFVTSDWPDYSPENGEERKVIPYLKDLGIEVQHPIWDKGDMDWRKFDAVIIRSTWDYPRKLEQFKKWLQRCGDMGVYLYNTRQVVNWNLEKTYLKEIEDWGFPVLATRWMNFDSAESFATKLKRLGWASMIVKPVVSNGAFKTLLVSSESVSTDFPYAAGEALMVQPFCKEITTEGEWSFMFIAGQFSHCVRKTPKQGDFRVQLHHGGKYVAETAPPEGLELAERLIQKLDPNLLYGRVDLIRVDNIFRVMEVELIEPSLYLDFSEEAPERFAKAIAIKCG